MSTIEDMVNLLDATDVQDLRYEVKKYRAIKEWAFKQAGIDFLVGDKVEIHGWTAQKDGWWPSRECLHEGAIATVMDIDFSPHSMTWYADVVLDREWSVSDYPGGKADEVKTRFWHGPVNETPEGYTPPGKFDQENYPNGRKHTYSFNVKYLRKLTEELPPPDPKYCQYCGQRLDDCNDHQEKEETS